MENKNKETGKVVTIALKVIGGGLAVLVILWALGVI